MRPLAVFLAGLTLATGCAGSTYEIPHKELMRISTLPPEQKSSRVFVDQEITTTDVGTAEPVRAETEIIWIPDFNVSGSYGYAGGRRPRPGTGDVVNGVNVGGGGNGGGGVKTGGGGGGKGSGLNLGSGGGDGKAAAVAVVVLAVVGLVVLAGVEGSRYDGWVRLHPMHPVHLFGADGTQTIMPLAWIDPQTAAWTEKAIIRPDEGPWNQLGRGPLQRAWTYGVYGGYGSTRSVTGAIDYGPSFLIQGGYFPINEVGILANVQFAWRDNQFGGTLFDSRYSLELQALPLKANIFHAGGYANGGFAYRWEDVPGGTVSKNDQGGATYGAGAMVQLELHSRIALTGRAGAFVEHGDRAMDFLLGMSVY